MMEETAAGGVEFLGITEVELDTPTPQAGSVIRHIREDSDRVVANWVIRVANMPAFRAWPDLGLDQLKDSIPDLIDAMMIAMRTGDSEHDPVPLSRAVEIAAEHGRKRGRNGFPIGAMLAEFQALRDELLLALQRVVGDDPAWHGVARELERRLTHAVDAGLIDAAEAWVDETLNQARSA